MFVQINSCFFYSPPNFDFEIEQTHFSIQFFALILLFDSSLIIGITRQFNCYLIVVDHGL